MASISENIRQHVFAESDHRCEYCLTSRRLIGMPLIIDHIVPRSAGGDDNRENLAAACYRCNEFKWAKTHATDPATGELGAFCKKIYQNGAGYLCRDKTARKAHSNAM
jgi:5-methylcytosine-specific restriction endonuclease McrA